MRDNTNANLQRLKRTGVITNNTSPSDIAGYLAVAHLLGAKGAKDWKETGAGKDGNGTTGQRYFDLGSGSVSI